MDYLNKWLIDPDRFTLVYPLLKYKDKYIVFVYTGVHSIVVFYNLKGFKQSLGEPSSHMENDLKESKKRIFVYIFEDRSFQKELFAGKK
jgi:hypothetical protein